MRPSKVRKIKRLKKNEQLKRDGRTPAQIARNERKKEKKKHGTR